MLLKIKKIVRYVYIQLVEHNVVKLTSVASLAYAVNFFNSKTSAAKRAPGYIASTSSFSGTIIFDSKG